MAENDFKKRRMTRRKKPCSFCMEKAASIDFKDVGKLKRFVTERGKIMPRRMTGNCAQHQRQLSMAVKRARLMAMLPYSID